VILRLISEIQGLSPVTREVFFRGAAPVFSNNREINTDFSVFLSKIHDLCPDLQILLFGTAN